MRRLAIDSFPSLFLIDGSLTRRYQGIRAQDQVHDQAPACYVYRAPWSSHTLHVCPSDCNSTSLTQSLNPFPYGCAVGGVCQEWI